MMQLSRIFRGKKSRSRIVEELLNQISLQARHPAFFEEGRTVDTLDGRFEMVAIHAILILRRLRLAGKEGQILSRKLSDGLFDRFDYALRETGVGDMSIARKVRSLGENFVGRAQSYDAALDNETSDLKEVLRRNLFDVISRENFYSGLEAYMRVSATELSKLSDDEIVNGEVSWADIELLDAQ